MIIKGIVVSLSCRVFFLLFMASGLSAEECHVAVASNFLQPATRLAQEFGRVSPHRVRLSSGASGMLFAQVRQGAPFDVFLSADVETAQKLEEEKLGVPSMRYTYAVGKVVLASPRYQHSASLLETLKENRFERLAIANPLVAPYGRAAREILVAYGLLDKVSPKIVFGENINQTFQFMLSGSVDLGLVALSQIRGTAAFSGSFIQVPDGLYRPVRQDAVLLARAQDNQAAKSFFEFIRTGTARSLIQDFGYDIP